MDAQVRSPLVLSWQRRRAVLDDRRSNLTLGAVADAGLQVEGEFTSRCHATIERRKQFYVLVDHSTNGTFVQTEDEQVSYVHRGELTLWGEGWISLGEPPSAASAVRFRHD
ncbi:MAG: FHA domain-containing protein [Pseudomonadota bacterium]